MKEWFKSVVYTLAIGALLTFEFEYDRLTKKMHMLCEADLGD
jgi:hypothetical protein